MMRPAVTFLKLSNIFMILRLKYFADYWIINKCYPRIIITSYNSHQLTHNTGFRFPEYEIFLWFYSPTKYYLQIVVKYFILVVNKPGLSEHIWRTLTN